MSEKSGALPGSVASTAHVQVTTVYAAPAANSTVPKERNRCDAHILAVALGFLGAHHFYLRRFGFGVLYFCTFGLLGVGWIVDWFRTPILVKRENKRAADRNSVPPKSLDDAYLLWFPLFGFLGFHHFYLHRWPWAFAYFVTLGFLGIGWIIDAFRMKRLVEKANAKLQGRAAAREGPRQAEKSVGDAYLLCLVPFTGLLGAHHYYLGRIGFGMLYTFTLGLLGVGWLFDIIRLSCLVNGINKDQMSMDTSRRHMKRLDDAYICCFPLGFLGLHHFYLARPGWGVLYFCTFGLLGIGWIVDFFRLPRLVKDYNKRIAGQNLSNIAAVPVAYPVLAQQGGLGATSYQTGYPGTSQTALTHGPYTLQPGANPQVPVVPQGAMFPGQPTTLQVNVVYPPQNTHQGYGSMAYGPPAYTHIEQPPPYDAVSPGADKMGNETQGRTAAPSAPDQH